MSQARFYRHRVTVEQAELLLAALASGSVPMDYSARRAVHPDAERDLQQHGLVHTEYGVHHPRVAPEVRYGLRYEVDADAL